MAVLAAGIAHFPRRSMSFFDAGDDLAANGTVFIRWSDEVDEIWSDRKREPAICQCGAGVCFCRKRRHEALALIERSDSALKLPNPVASLLVENIVTKACSGR